MRIATYNVEWFNALFDDQGTLLQDEAPSARHGISRKRQIQALAMVFSAMDADAVMIIEAPDDNLRRSTRAALETFAEMVGLRARKVAIGFANETQQEIAMLYDPDVISVRHDPQQSETAPRFDQVFHIDLDIDAKMDAVQFSKPPLELVVETADGRSVRIIGAHLKSKAPHGAATRDEIMRRSIANRRKQLAQAVWLRRRVEGHLAAGDSLIVMGDLNDGPGLDEYEHLFGRSSVEIVMAPAGDENGLYDPHARQALQRRLGAAPTTARFYLKDQKRYLQALLDYIMISSDLMARRPAWRIWHPFDDPTCWQDQTLCEALLTASDHFPVVLDIDL